MPPENRPSDSRNYLMLAGLATIWGGSFLMIKLAVTEIPPVSIAAFRVVLAAILLTLYCRMARIPLPRKPGTWALILPVAVIGNAIPFTLIGWGEEVLDSGLAAILMGINPLVALVLAHLLTADEKMRPASLAGVIIGFTGLVILFGPEKILLLGEETIRQMAVAGAACCYAVASLLNKRLAGESFRAISAGVMIASSVILIPMSLIMDRPWTLTPGPQALLAVVALGVFATALGNIMLLSIIRNRGAAFFSQINYLVPVSGVIWGVVFLAERPAPSTLLALALILCGIALSRRRSGDA